MTTSVASSTVLRAGGPTIAFVSTKSPLETGSYSRLLLMDSDGTNQRVLFGRDDNAFAPAISPDGRRIAFSVIQGGAGDVYVSDIDGHGRLRISGDAELNTAPQFSPDGSEVVYTCRGDN